MTLYALSLVWPGYLIHGTNHPYSIGRPSSHDCMPLYPEDIKANLPGPDRLLLAVKA